MATVIPAAPMTPALASRLEAAFRHHREGDLAAAEAAYRAILAENPDAPHALHLLGVARLQGGDPAEAVALLERAVALLPTEADFHTNLGAAYHAAGALPQAENSFRRTVELDPAHIDASANLAAILSKQGKKAEAVARYRAVARLCPGEPRFLRRIADLSIELNDYEASVEAYGAYLAVVPDDAEAHNNLAYAFEHLDDFEGAERHYRRACDLEPELPEFLNNLATTLNRLGRTDEADRYLVAALAKDPEKWADPANIGGALVNARNYEDAEAILLRMIEQDPDNADLHYTAAVTYMAVHRFADAIRHFERCIAIAPDTVRAHVDMGAALLAAKRTDEGIEALRKAIALDPRTCAPQLNLSLTLMRDRALYDEAYIYAKSAVMQPDFTLGRSSNARKVLLAMCDFDSLEEIGTPWEIHEATNLQSQSSNFLDMLVAADTPENVARAFRNHADWGREYTRRNATEPFVHAPRRGDSKLRLGIASSDLRNHSVARFVKPLFRNYDRDRFEIYCYTPFEAKGDSVQAELSGLVDRFVVLADTSPRDAARTVHDHAVDILFDLGGLTADSMLYAFIHRPAPVQITWLGYPFTPGIADIDYALLDGHVVSRDPGWMVEKPLLMADSWVCFGDELPDVPIDPAPPFEREGGTISFGTMNNPYKFTRATIGLWARIMTDVPNSRFVVVRPESASTMFQENLIAEFAKHGVARERLVFFSNILHRMSNLPFYNLIDISLDTFPVTGGTTTCDSLWMGVPVVARLGPAQHHRMSHSILENAGAGELCGETDEDYVRIAVALANDTASLREYRYGLRPALKRSPLCDAEGFTENFQNLMTEIARRHGLR